MTIIEAFPTGFASLSDGTTTIPFIFTDGQGKKNPLSFRSDPYPRTALKTTTGESKYSDLEPPYFALPQDDFTGGRGNEDFENDTSRYFDGWRLDTSKEGGVVLGGRETYSTGYKNADFVMPGSMLFKSLFTTESEDQYFATTFEASASYTTYQCEIWLKRTGTPASIKVELWSDSGGTEPNAMLCTKTLTPAEVTSDTLGVSVLRAFIWTGAGSNEDIVDGTDYWVVVIADGSDYASNYWQLGTQSGVTGKFSDDAGSTWSNVGSGAPYFRITPIADKFKALFFEYKRGFYMITQQEDGGNSALYINGDRGTADDNSGNKARLNDSTKSWTAGEWTGAIVQITNGPGEQEEQNWRTILTNDTNWVSVSPSWNITHTVDTEYVFLGTDKWTSVVADLGAYATDVKVASDSIYIAYSETAATIDRYLYYNLFDITAQTGVWTQVKTDEGHYASKLLSIRHPNTGFALYHAINDDLKYGVSVGKADVPWFDRALFHDRGQLVATGIAWADRSVANVTQSHNEGATKIAVAAGHTTGVVAVKDLDTPIDATNCSAITMLIKSSATGGISSGNLQLKYDDVEDLGKTWSPSKILKADYARSFAPTKIYHHDDPSGTPTYTDLPAAYDGASSSLIVVAVTNDDYLCIGASEKFNKITWNLTVVNDVVSTMNVYYYQGTGITAVSGLTDGTETGGNTTMGQDGTMSFTLPMDWVTSTINGTEAYWIRMSPTVSLLATMSIADCYLTSDEIASNTPVYTDLANVYDGFTSKYITLNWAANNDFIFIGHATKFNKITVTMDGTDNTVTSTMTAAYWDKSVWQSVTITDGTLDTARTLFKSGDITFTIPEDWETTSVNGTETYWIRLQVSVALTPKIIIKEITVTRQNNVTLNIPALLKDTWTWVSMAIAPEEYPLPDDSSISSIGINVATDKAAQDIEIRDVRIVSPLWGSDKVSRLPSSFRINGMEAYAGNVDDPVENPWIFTEGAVYELQTQNNDQVVAIPLRELSSLQSSENGLGHCVNGTYLYFNVGEKIERYFNRTLDDIGPDRDEGLPDDRPGIPKSLASYPGRVYAGVDAGTSGTSSALALDGSAWHEVYRAPDTNLRIKSIHVQAIPGTNVDKLWISMGSDILWLPISLNPYNETDYAFTHEGQLVTSWIYAGMQDVVKTWKSLKLFQEIDANRHIAVDYMVDVDTTWTKLSAFTQAPVQERDIASPLPQSKRIKFRLRFISYDESITPRLKAMVTEGVAFVPVKTKYSWTFVISKDSQNIDLKGKWNSDLTSLQKRDKLLTWANAGTPLTMRHYSAVYDNKTVWVDPASVAPLRVVAHEDIENHVTQLSCFDY